MQIAILNPRGEALDSTMHEGTPKRRDLVVIGHGVTGNKDRPFAVALAKHLAAAGIGALRFSFSGNGDSEGAFVDSTVTAQVEDLGAVLDALPERRIAYVGHSQGAAVGVLRARRDDRVRLLVSLGGMVDLCSFAQAKFGELVPERDCMWDKPECPLSSIYMNDMESIGTVLEAASQIRVPWLLVHGTEDTVVPIQDSRNILARCGDGVELFTIAGADHVFTGKAMELMAQKVVSWLAEGFAALDAP